ncbi:hypothetical protein [Pseudomonas citronellolis]|uniref:hypothetical protein n=1 Tax=Pseudomonas citronellolis TaxID=53408 RepID=UPI002FDB68A9
MTMAMELIRHIAGLYSGKAIKGDFTQVYITGNEIWMAQQVLAEQAEGAQGDLWAVHAKGPDDLYAAFSREDAEKHAAELNALPMPEGIAVSAVVVASPWPAAEHWKYLAEQEREHNGALVAQAGQVPEGYMLITQDQVERHATTAWECPPQSRVVLVSTLKRLHEKNSAVPQPAGGE